MALGAEPAGVVRLVLVRVFVLVALGVIIGTAVSWWSSQFIASLLYDLQPRDAVTLVSAAVTLTAVGAIAGWLPAYRASRIDPAQVPAGQLSGRRAFANRSIEALHIDSQRRHQSIGRDKSPSDHLLENANPTTSRTNYLESQPTLERVEVAVRVEQ